MQNVNNHLQNVSKIPKTLERESHIGEKIDLNRRKL